MFAEVSTRSKRVVPRGTKADDILKTRQFPLQKSQVCRYDEGDEMTMSLKRESMERFVALGNGSGRRSKRGFGYLALTIFKFTYPT